MKLRSNSTLHRRARLLLVAVLVTLGVLTYASQAPGSFGVATSFAVGTTPRSVAIGYLNGDGFPDLAATNYDSNNVSILLGTGNGNFGTATNFPAGTGPQSVAIGNLNGDSFPDLAITNLTSASVSVLLGNGAGSFGGATSFTAGTSPTSVAIGNLNGDGFPDLAVANNGSGTVSVLLGTGTGSFGLATNFPAGSGARSVAIGNLNGDGLADLAVANVVPNNVSILLGTGSGTFGAATNFVAGTSPTSVAIGNLNGDSFPDLAVANETSSNVSVLLGTGTGSFGAAANFAAGSGSRSVAIGNLNGDSFPDLAVAGGTDKLSILLATGTGSFSAATSVPAGGDTQSVAIGNLSSDGFPDLAVANGGANTVSVLLNSGPTATAAPTSLTFPSQAQGTLSGQQTVTVSNGAEGYPLEVSEVSVIGTNRNDFLVSGETCTGVNVPASGTCDVSVRFGPSAVGAESATLEFRYEGAASPLTVPLSGTGGGLPTGPTGATGPTGPQGEPGRYAAITKVNVSGPGKAKKGKASTWKVGILNSGNSTAEGVRLKASSRGISFNTSVVQISAGTTRTVSVKVKPKDTGKVKVTFKVTSDNAGGRTVTKTVTVK